MVHFCHRAAQVLPGQGLEVPLLEHHPGRHQWTGGGEGRAELDAGPSDPDHVGERAGFHRGVVLQRQVIQPGVRGGGQQLHALLLVIPKTGEFQAGNRCHGMVQFNPGPGVPLRWDILPGPVVIHGHQDQDQQQPENQCSSRQGHAPLRTPSFRQPGTCADLAEPRTSSLKTIDGNNRPCCRSPLGNTHLYTACNWPSMGRFASGA